MKTIVKVKSNIAIESVKQVKQGKGPNPKLNKETLDFLRIIALFSGPVLDLSSTKDFKIACRIYKAQLN